jgi:hypothetical protein
VGPRSIRVGLGAERVARRVEEALARRRDPRPTETLPLRSPVGHALPCRMHLPAGAGPWPAVVLAPGGLDGVRGVEGLSPVLTAPRLAREGFAAVAWSPSGRDGAPGEEDRNGHVAQEEMAEVLRLVLDHPRVSSVAVLSISFGVVLAVGALVRHPDLAARVRVFVDWEGPPSRRWFQAQRLAYWTHDEAWWEPREAARHVGALRCPYWRFQSAWDHVHGPDNGLGLELARAAAAGVSPDVRLNGAPPPFEPLVLGPVGLRAQAAVMVGWLREARGTGPER